MIKKILKILGILLASFVALIVLVGIFAGSDEPAEQDTTEKTSEVKEPEARPTGIDGLKEQITEALGESTNRKVPKNTSFIHLKKKGVLFVEFALNDNFSKNSIVSVGIREGLEVLKIVQDSDVELKELNIQGTFSMVDEYNNPIGERVVLLIRFNESLYKINTEGFITDRIWTAADHVYLHPAFR
jgi:hypothetical protein